MLSFVCSIVCLIFHCLCDLFVGEEVFVGVVPKRMVVADIVGVGG